MLISQGQDQRLVLCYSVGLGQTTCTSSPSFAQSVLRDTKENQRKKWPHKLLGASMRKEGLPSKPESLTFHGIFGVNFQSHYIYPTGFLILMSSHYHLLLINPEDILNEIALLFDSRSQVNPISALPCTNIFVM